MTQRVKIADPNTARSIMVAELILHPTKFFIVAHNEHRTEFYHIGSGTIHRVQDGDMWRKWNPGTRTFETVGPKRQWAAYCPEKTE